MDTNIIAVAMQSIIEQLDPNPSRVPLNLCATRFANACETWFDGYGRNAAPLVAGGAPNVNSDYNDLVVHKNIPFFSWSDVDFVPFFGHVTIAYMPTDRILFAENLRELVALYAQRLTSADQLAVNVSNAIATHGGVAGVGVLVTYSGADRAREQNTAMKTWGIVEMDSARNAQFMNLIGRAGQSQF